MFFSAATTEKLRDELSKSRLDQPHPGFIISTQINGICNSEYFGFAELEHSIPIDQTTIFHVASIAKQFTAFGIATAIARKKIRRDTEIGSILDWLSAPQSSCTIEQLLFHTSGIKDCWSLAEFAGLRDSDSITTDDVKGWLISQNKLNFSPGTRFLYSNSGYVLLALALEHLFDTEFTTLMDDLVFKPLEMSSTFFVTDPMEPVSNGANGYRYYQDSWQKWNPNYGVIGATCLKSNAIDMHKWLSLASDSMFFSEADKGGYFDRGKLSNGKAIEYGFGIIHRSLGGDKIIMHGGLDYGFNALTVRDEKNSRSIFAASNGDLPQIQRFILNTIFKDVGVSHRGKPAEIGLIEGFYVNDDLTDFREIKRSPDNTLILHWAGEFRITQLSESSFWINDISLMIINKGNGNLIFKSDETCANLSRIIPSAYKQIKWKGEFYNSNLSSTVKLITSDEGPMITIGRGETRKVRHINDEFCIADHIWIKINTDGSELISLTLSQLRCTNIKFNRLWLEKSD